MVDVEAQNPPLSEFLFTGGFFFSFCGGVSFTVFQLNALLLNPAIGKKCLGNVMRIDVGPLGGKNLEVAAVMSKYLHKCSPGLYFQSF